MPKLKDFKFEDTPFANLLLNLSAFKLTGWIEAYREQIMKRVFIHEGILVNANSTDEQDKIGMILVSQGKLTREQLETALRKQVPGKKLGAILVEFKFIKLDDLVWALTAQVKQIIISLFDWEEGIASVYQNKLPDDLTRLALNTDRLMVEGIRSVTNPRVILRGLGNMNTCVKITHLKPETVQLLQLNQDDQNFLKILEEREFTIKQLCQMNKRPAWETYLLLYLLLATGSLVQL